MNNTEQGHSNKLQTAHATQPILIYISLIFNGLTFSHQQVISLFILVFLMSNLSMSKLTIKKKIDYFFRTIL